MLNTKSLKAKKRRLVNMAKCLYTEQELNKLLARAISLFVIESDNLAKLLVKAAELEYDKDYDFLLFNSLGKSLKAVDMYRTQIAHLETLKRRFYFKPPTEE